MDIKILRDIPPWEWPRDARKQFLRILTDNRADAIDRLVAAELAGDITVINEELATALLKIAGAADQPEHLRAKAVISLGPILEHSDLNGFDDPYDDSPISESTFENVLESLRELYLDANVPKLVRRRILEASVRATNDWHQDSIAAAYASGDRDWVLTAVFAMEYVRGFDKQILEALQNTDPDIHCHAVTAAGNWGIAAAYPHIAALAKNRKTPKALLLAAIGAVASIRPQEGKNILFELADSKDEEIAEAADEAISMAEAGAEDDEYDKDSVKWIN